MAKEVYVDGRSARSDDDALEGGFAKVVKGEYAGRTVVVEKVLLRGDKGYPTGVQVRTRDADSLELNVPYDSLKRLHGYNGGR